MNELNSAAKLGGYSSPSAFLRAAINKELGQGREGLGHAEEQIVASIRKCGRTSAALSERNRRYSL